MTTCNHFKIRPKHELCEECIEYVCSHTYPCLSLENCSICLEPLSPGNVVYLNACGHTFHRNCILTTTSYAEVARSDMLKEEHRLNTAMINAEEHISDSQRIAFINGNDNAYIALKLKEAFSDNHKCPYCTIKSDKLLTYEEVFRLCSNSIMPPIASVSMGEYHWYFNKYKIRLNPTPQMLDYLKTSKELIGERLLLLQQTNISANPRSMYNYLYNKK